MDTLGNNVPQNIKEKIWKGKYIDLNILDTQGNSTHTSQEMGENQGSNLAIIYEGGRLVLNT